MKKDIIYFIIVAACVLGFMALLANSVHAAAITPISGGGTQTSTAPNNGFLLIGNASHTYSFIASSSLGGGGGSGSVTTSSAPSAFNFPYWANTTGGLSGTSTLFYASSTGYIGIGSGTPAYPLQVFYSPGGVSPGIVITNTTVGSGNESALWLTSPNNTASTDRNWGLGTNNTVHGSLEFIESTSPTTTPSISRVTLDGSGNVGIGTATTTDANGNTALQVKGAAGHDALSLTDGTSSFGIYLNNTNRSNGIAPVQFGSISNDSLGFFTNNSAPQMTIATSGNVGIGTSTPGYALTLGSGQLSVPAGSASAPAIVVGNPAEKNGLWSSSGYYLDIGENGGEGIEINSAGHVSVNGTLFLSTLTDTAISRGAANKVYVGTGGSDFSGTLIAGNIGIGTTQPSSTFHVVSNTTTTATFVHSGVATTTIIQGSASSTACSTFYTPSGTAIYSTYLASGQIITSQTSCQ